jgi:hypothetical protein
MGEIPERIVASAESCVGLGADVDAVAYGQRLGGLGETPQMCLAMATYVDPRTGKGVSTCGLQVRACWREAGVPDPGGLLSAPYAKRIGMVISDLWVIANHAGALTVLTTSSPLPELHAGDCLGVDCDAPDGHVYTLVTEPMTNDDGSVTACSVDGGQGSTGHEKTTRREKTLRRGVYGWWYDQATDGGPSRRVTHHVAAGRLG